MLPFYYRISCALVKSQIVDWRKKKTKDETNKKPHFSPFLKKGRIVVEDMKIFFHIFLFILNLVYEANVYFIFLWNSNFPDL